LQTTSILQLGQNKTHMFAGAMYRYTLVTTEVYTMLIADTWLMYFHIMKVYKAIGSIWTLSVSIYKHNILAANFEGFI
jgi:hypothetical protein